MKHAAIEANTATEGVEFITGEVLRDPAVYDEYLQASGMSEAEKDAFLESMWVLIVTLMKLGFRVPDAKN